MASQRQRKRRGERRREHATPLVHRTDGAADGPGPCLFCLSTQNPFTSREHIVAESIVGDSDKVLPVGAVCDPCNNGPLSVLDNELANFLPVALMRAIIGIPSKRGKLPTVRTADAVIERHVGDHLEIQSSHKRVWTDTGPNQFNLSLTGKRNTPKYLAQLVRGLYKITLELIYLDHGPELALSSRFDEVRRIVLGQPFSGYVLIVKSTQPSPEASFTYEFTRFEEGDTVTISAWIFGANLATDLELRRIKYPERIPRDMVDVLEFST